METTRERKKKLKVEASIVDQIEDLLEDLDWGQRNAVLQYLILRKPQVPEEPTYADGSPAGPGTMPPDHDHPHPHE